MSLPRKPHSKKCISSFNYQLSDGMPNKSSLQTLPIYCMRDSWPNTHFDSSSLSDVQSEPFIFLITEKPINIILEVNAQNDTLSAGIVCSFA